MDGLIDGSAQNSMATWLKDFKRRWRSLWRVGASDFVFEVTCGSGFVVVDML